MEEGEDERKERFPISGDKTNFRYIDYRSCIFQLLFPRHANFSVRSPPPASSPFSILEWAGGGEEGW